MKNDEAAKIDEAIADKIGDFNQNLRDTIYNSILNQVPKGQYGELSLDQKDLRELPFSQFYDIVDDWGGVFKAQVLFDKDKSQYGKA